MKTSNKQIVRLVEYNHKSGRYRVSSHPGEYSRRNLPSWAKRWLAYQSRNEIDRNGDPVSVNPHKTTKGRLLDVYGPLACAGFGEQPVYSMDGPGPYDRLLRINRKWIRLLRLPVNKFERAVNIEIERIIAESMAGESIVTRYRLGYVQSFAQGDGGKK